MANASRRTAVNLSQEAHERLRRIARVTNRSMSNWLNSTLESHESTILDFMLPAERERYLAGKMSYAEARQICCRVRWS